LLHRYREQLGYGSDRAALEALAATLAGQVPAGSRLLLRLHPRPLLAIEASAAAVAAGGVAAQIRALRDGCERLTYFDRAGVDQLVRILASKLRTQLGHRLRTAQFVAVPHGGTHVLQLLLRELGIRQPTPRSPSAPIVIVDDSVLTGHRVGILLQSLQPADAILAHLASHPAAREAILRKEPSVRACLAPIDLCDLAPERIGRKYEQWRSRALRRLAPPRYWVGQTEHLCFPWTEAGRSIGESCQPAWKLVPPERCSGNTAAIGTPCPIEIQPPPTGPFRPPGNVATSHAGGVVLLASGNRLVSLHGSAAAIWQALLQFGSRDGATEKLVAEYDVDRDRARADVDRFATDLLLRGLLVEQVDA
jgi:Coenzyme PQQ synthesis protein D (PqqD)